MAEARAQREKTAAVAAQAGKEQRNPQQHGGIGVEGLEQGRHQGAYNHGMGNEKYNHQKMEEEEEVAQNQAKRSLHQEEKVQLKPEEMGHLEMQGKVHQEDYIMDIRHKEQLAAQEDQQSVQQEHASEVKVETSDTADIQTKDENVMVKFEVKAEEDEEGIDVFDDEADLKEEEEEIILPPKPCRTRMYERPEVADAFLELEDSEKARDTSKKELEEAQRIFEESRRRYVIAMEEDRVNESVVRQRKKAVVEADFRVECKWNRMFQKLKEYREKVSSRSRKN